MSAGKTSTHGVGNEPSGGGPSRENSTSRQLSGDKNPHTSPFSKTSEIQTLFEKPTPHGRSSPVGQLLTTSPSAIRAGGTLTVTDGVPRGGGGFGVTPAGTGGV